MNRRLYCMWAMAFIVAWGRTAVAVEPTHLEPAEEVTPREFEVEQNLEYVNIDDDFFESETELSYGLNRRLQIGATFEVEHEDEEGTEIGDTGAFLEGVLNPDSPQRFLVGGRLELLFPTGEDSDGLGGEIQLRLSKYFKEGDIHGIHLNVFGYFDTEEENDRYDRFHLLRPLRSLRDLRRGRRDDEENDDTSFGAALGYTYNASPDTRLTANAYYREDFEGNDDAVLAEVGISHDFNEVFSAGLGVGAGLTSDSPDFEAKLTFSIAFGGK